MHGGIKIAKYSLSNNTFSEVIVLQRMQRIYKMLPEVESFNNVESLAELYFGIEESQRRFD